MIQWFEGEIISYEDPLGQEDPVIRCTVREISQKIEIKGVQMPLVSAMQPKPKVGSKIAFYRDTAATAKYGFQISDPLPIGSPIAIETAIKAAQDGEKVYNEGEIALSALGDSDGFYETEGGQLWLRNTGDAILASGSYNQRVMCSDSSDSVDIEGSNIDIYGHGNLISTHFFNIDTQSFTGVTTLALGLRNPITGVYVTRLKCDSLGAFTIGAEDPALGSLLSGFSYNLVPGIPSPLVVPECKIMSLPLISQITTNPLGTTINGQSITIGGTATLTSSVPAPAVSVNVLSALTSITGAVSIKGATSIVGATSISGATTIDGATAITGATAVTGTLSATGIVTAPAYFVGPIPGLTGVFSIAGHTITVAGGLVIAIA